MRADRTAAWRPSEYVTPLTDGGSFEATEANGILTLRMPELTRRPELVIRYDAQTRDLAFLEDGEYITIFPGSRPRLSPREIFAPLRNGMSDVVTHHTSDGLKTSAGAAERTLDRMALSARLDFDWVEGEAIYGLGQHEEGHLNLRGTRQDLYHHNTKIAIPFLLSSWGYGVLVDCASLIEFSDLGEESYLWCSAVDQFDWYFIGGGSLPGVVASYRQLTGTAPLPPKAALGYVQSRERYETQDQLLEVAQEFADREIPLATIVLDWETWPAGQWGEKSFDASRFPDPSAMAARLHEQDVRLMMSIWPNLAGESPNHREMRDAGHLLGNDSVYNAFSPAARDLYWRQLATGLGAHGIDDWWTDCTEPFGADWQGAVEPSTAERLEMNVAEFERFLDATAINAYSLRHIQGLAEHQRVVSDRRMAVLSRSAFIGQQRYGAIVWSGDISATWEELRRQIPAGLNFMATGTPYWTFDVGGFFVKRKPELWFWRGDYEDGHADPAYRELYTRWLQVSVFLPVMRSHGTDTPREPWYFGEKGEPFYDAIVAAIELRTRLLPYLYSLADGVTARHGSMVTMLAFEFPGQEEALDISDQFMLGKEFLVAPVLKPGAASREVWLPAGCDWYDLECTELFAGGQRVSVATPLNAIPVFVRAGSLIPRTESDGSWTVSVYPGADGATTFYDDDGDGDGDTTAYESGAFWRVSVSWHDGDRRIALGVTEGSYAGPTMRFVDAVTSEAIPI